MWMKWEYALGTGYSPTVSGSVGDWRPGVRGRGTAQLLEGFPTHLTFMTITRQLDWAGGSPPTMHCTVSPHEAPSTSEDFAK